MLLHFVWFTFCNLLTVPVFILKDHHFCLFWQELFILVNLSLYYRLPWHSVSTTNMWNSEMHNCFCVFSFTIFPPQTLMPAGTNLQILQEQCGMIAASATAAKTLAGVHSFLTIICTGGASSKTMTSSLQLTSMVRIKDISSTLWLYYADTHKCLKKIFHKLSHIYLIHIQWILYSNLAMLALVNISSTCCFTRFDTPDRDWGACQTSCPK